VVPVSATDANGIILSGNNLGLEYGTATEPGIVSTSAQSFSGTKTFIAGVNTAQSILNVGNTTSSVVGGIQANGTQFVHNYGNNNFFSGFGAGNYTLTGVASVGVGKGALASLTNGNFNTACGTNALTDMQSGNNNCAFGYLALQDFNSTSSSNTAIGSTSMVGVSGSSGEENTCVGAVSGFALTSGSSNLLLGCQCGQTLTTGSNDIYLSAQAGSVSEANTIRIGTQGTQTSCYCAGIYTNTVGATNSPVYIDSTGLLGTYTPSPTFGAISYSGPFTSTTASTYNAQLSGGKVTLSFPEVFAVQTVSAVATTTTTLPAALIPTFSQFFPVYVYNASAASAQATLGVVGILSTGNISFALSTNQGGTLNGFTYITGTVSCGWAASTVTYVL